MTRIAVLASGRGSNLEALARHLALRATDAVEIAVVASHRADAGALALARERGIPTTVIDPADGAGIIARLAAHDVSLVVLAGYVRLLPPEVVRNWPGRIVNVHPALLPAFGGRGMYGRRVHAAVLASGARLTGVTVHFVDETYDRGPAIAQWPVPVLGDDTADVLAARVLRIEHLLFPRAVDAVARGRVRLEHGRAVWTSAASPRETAFTLGDADDATLVRNMEASLGG